MASPASRVNQEARLRTLARLNRLISSSLELDQVLAAIAEAAAELMGAPFVSFWIADERTRMLQKALSRASLSNARLGRMR